MGKYYRKRRQNDDGLALVILVLLIGIISFVLKNWLFCLSILILVLLCIIIYIIIDKKSNFKSVKYYQGNSSDEWLRELEKNPIGNEFKIKNLKYGIYGENNLIYTLMQSNISMYILHDLVLYYDDKRAQIDVMFVTKRCIYIIEAKNIKSNVTIENDGTFIRNYHKYKRGFKNPLTQNDEHKNVLNSIFKKEKIHLSKKYLVVLTNNDSYVRYKSGNDGIKNKIIRNDKLVSYIKKNEKNKLYFIKELKVRKISDAILKYTK